NGQSTGRGAPSDMIDQLKLSDVTERAHVRQGASVQNGRDGVAHIEHHQTHGAMLLRNTVLTGLVARPAGTGDRRQGPVENADDLPHRNLVRGAGQAVATV